MVWGLGFRVELGLWAQEGGIRLKVRGVLEVLNLGAKKL